MALLAPILGTEVIPGSAPKPYASRIDSHHVQLLGEDGSVLVTRAWQPVSVVVIAPPPMPGQGGEHSRPIEVRSRRTAVVLPYYPGVTLPRRLQLCWSGEAHPESLSHEDPRPE